MYKQIMIIFRDDEYFSKNVNQMFIHFRGDSIQINNSIILINQIIYLLYF